MNNLTSELTPHTYYTTSELLFQQTQLEHDLTHINNAICHINTTHNISTVRWDRDLLKTKIKRRGKNGKNIKKVTQSTYIHLFDGVHPDCYLQDKWYAIICHSLRSDLNPDTSSSEEEDDGQGETWDFKRHKQISWKHIKTNTMKIWSYI